MDRFACDVTRKIKTGDIVRVNPPEDTIEVMEGAIDEDSKYSGFYKLSVTDRLNEVADFAALTEGEKEMLRRDGALSLKEADRMIENAIGIMPIPWASQ